MAESIEDLERRIDSLRVRVRRAAMGGDRAEARALRAELRRAEHAWEEALTDLQEQAATVDLPPAVTARRPVGALLPVREQVHQALTLLGVPAAARLVVAVHAAFAAGEIASARLTSLRRDEERSFVSAPFARPYYVCSALTADLLGPARGLLAVSTWPMERRIVGPLSPRVNFLTAAAAVAEQVDRLADPKPAAAVRLLWRFAANIPGAGEGVDAVRPAVVARAARVELAVHEEADRAHRLAAAGRARRQLSDVEQLFGARLRAVPAAGAAG